MKKVVLTLMAIMSLQAHSYNGGWQLNQHGALTMISTTGELVLVIHSDKTIELVKYNESCYKTKPEWGAIKLKVNGQFISFAQYCHTGVFNVTYGSVSDAAKDFIMNEFKTKNKVTIGTTEFSGKGFTAKLKEQQQHIIDSQNAL